MIKNIIAILIIMSFVACSGSDSQEEEVPDENKATTKPSLIYPTNELLCTDNPLEFSWSPSFDEDGDVISYEIQVATDLAFSENFQVSTVTIPSANFTLLKGELYYWRVKAKDSKNLSSDFTSVWNFYSQGEGITNHIPYAPSLISPALNESVLNASLNLKWSASDEDGDLLSYDVYFGTSTLPELVAENITETGFNVNLNLTETTYYWKIVVRDVNGAETLGQTWFFNSN
ncbi:hypothetical protein BST83_11270 [Polaribacter filamentus]|jgi:hypothetical protein|uniref:Fibronectin type-III domain-containing protein n=1 Tax=Polaribacter filamentus TaxID=53483 RepID=A0A2S7KYC6_9FLAO|nr:hypothetical protein [Polaribacter filamentus]PQB07669.1 hypothetical protein BST83_11270 [Polaribacter filamentus]